MAGQIFTVNLPDIGEGVVEGEVVEWLKKVGDGLAQDEPVVVVMTDKATVELPAPYPGILAKQYYQPGEISIKDKPLYDIQLNVELAVKPSTKSASHPKIQPCIQPEPIVSISGKSASGPQQSEFSLATPKVRHLAKELGINLSSIHGSGKEGRILVQDLTSHRSDNGLESAVSQHYPESQEVPLIGVRGMMAKKMAQAAEIPMFSYFEQVDVTRLIQVKQNIKQKAREEGINLSFMPFFIRALSLCIHKHPLLNSSIDMQSRKVFIHPHHHIGIAMATEQGLIVPVLKDVQKMSLEKIIRGFEILKNKAKNNALEPHDMRGATITISNFGALPGNGQWATPIINVPEVAILAIGHKHSQPVVHHNTITSKEIIPFSWSFDHRVLDGAQAASISHYYCSLIREPASLL